MGQTSSKAETKPKQKQQKQRKNPNVATASARAKTTRACNAMKAACKTARQMDDENALKACRKAIQDCNNVLK